jgi:gliding motility-associated-like protein
MSRYTAVFIALLLGSILSAQNPNDCTNSINLCGDTDLDIIPSGVGQYEFNTPNNPPPGCFNFNSDQVWFRVEIETTGTFTFTLSPEQSQADYDFAVFGPTTSCNNLGPSIRCSSTNPAGAGVSGDTGLNDTETDLSEGPGPNGNGFLKELDVNAGEVYYIIIGLAQGDGGFSMTTSGSANLPPPPVINEIAPVEYCDDIGFQDGIIQLDFSDLAASLTGTPNTVITYFETANDANINDNPIVFPYTNTSADQTIFIRAERTDSDCVNFGEFLIDVDQSNIDFTADTIFVCSDNTQEQLDIAERLEEIFPGSAAFDITYYNTFSDATSGVNSQSSMRMVTGILSEVVLRYRDPSGQECEFYVTAPYQVSEPPQITAPQDINSLCDDDFDEMLEVSLTQQNAIILDGLDPALHNVRYYRTAIDRRNQVNDITSTIVDGNVQQIFVEVINTRTNCSSQIQFSTQLNLRPDLADQDPKIYCLNATQPLTLEVESGFTFYEWSNGDMGANAFTTQISAPGDYTVTVTNAAGCNSDLTITVEPSDVAIIEDIETDNFNNGNNMATIIVAGPGNYEFKVDDTAFQDSNVLDELYRGFHLLTVRDKNGCGSISQEFVVLDYEQFFTPNGDGFNDTWTLEGISEFPGAVLKIFDRHGKFLYQLASQQLGWDGTFNGNPLPSTTYWFTLDIPDKPVTRGFFALKR